MTYTNEREALSALNALNTLEAQRAALSAAGSDTTAVLAEASEIEAGLEVWREYWAIEEADLDGDDPENWDDPDLYWQWRAAQVRPGHYYQYTIPEAVGYCTELEAYRCIATLRRDGFYTESEPTPEYGQDEAEDEAEPMTFAEALAEMFDELDIEDIYHEHADCNLVWGDTTSETRQEIEAQLQARDAEQAALDEVITIAEACDTYSLTRQTVQHACATGQLIAKKSGTTWLISAASAARRWGRRLTIILSIVGVTLAWAIWWGIA